MFKHNVCSTFVYRIYTALQEETNPVLKCLFFLPSVKCSVRFSFKEGIVGLTFIGYVFVITKYIIVGLTFKGYFFLITKYRIVGLSFKEYFFVITKYSQSQDYRILFCCNDILWFYIAAISKSVSSPACSSACVVG